MQRLPFPHLVAQRYDHGELQAAVSGVVQNDVPDELHKKGILHQRTPEAIRIEALRTGMGDGTQTPQGDGQPVRNASIEYLIEQLSKAGTCASYQYKRGKGEKLSAGKSCASSIGKVLTQVMKEFEQRDTDSEQEESSSFEKAVVSENRIIASIREAKAAVHDIEEAEIFTPEEKGFLDKYGDTAFAMRYNKCPECGNHLEHIDGCLSDVTGCGWSKCGG
jgi:hypothetical protein